MYQLASGFFFFVQSSQKTLVRISYSSKHYWVYNENKNNTIVNNDLEVKEIYSKLVAGPWFETSLCLLVFPFFSLPIQVTTMYPVSNNDVLRSSDACSL